MSERDKLQKELEELQAEIPIIKQKAGQEAIKKSHTVIRGKVTEEIVSLVPGFPYVASDCKFMAMPVDYLVFENMSEVRDSGEGEITIVIADVKTGKAKLSPVERAIKLACENKNIRFETWRISENGIDVDAGE